ncbi:hypothetical protein Sste5346_004554 [Sporothrix stenoceras]|uniref:Aminoglycoside phosphotransferase domain-containing protein n=1 Tax=Sporothrix stenoceras TaxID=5173 RepID=A0ABR3Z8X4_9PEZI
MAPSFEEYDDLAWDHDDGLFQAWRKTLLEEDLQRAVAGLISKHQVRSQPIELCAPRKGAFNIYYRLRYAQKPDAIARFPIPAYFQYAKEKLDAEVAAMRHVADHTTIPVPFVLHHGTCEESPVGQAGPMGPFVVMEWVENTGELCDVLNTPGLTLKDKPLLNPNIPEGTLSHLYGLMADVLLQLSQCTFGAIGALVETPDGTVRAGRRPMSLNMWHLGSLARVPHSVLPDVTTTYATAKDYYQALADMHLQQLSFQRNNAVDSAADARKKYIARQLFRKLAAEDRLAGCIGTEAAEHNKTGPFTLWCDDLRPANVLVNASDGVGEPSAISAVIDWEFSYAAPVDFVQCPPWWLLLVAPEDWKGGLDDWVEHYKPRLDTFLRAMEDKGDAGRQLAGHMRQSWQTGHFWVVYAAQRTWAFDAIYWRFLDTKFYGPYPDDGVAPACEDARIGELSSEQVSAMDAFVARKMREKEEARLVDWYAPSAEVQRASYILNIL